MNDFKHLGLFYLSGQRLEAGEVNATVKTLVRASEAIGSTIWENFTKQ